MLSVVKKFGIFPVRSRGSMRFLYRALHWLQIGCQNPGKLTVGAYPSVVEVKFYPFTFRNSYQASPSVTIRNCKNNLHGSKLSRRITDEMSSSKYGISTISCFEVNENLTRNMLCGVHNLLAVFLAVHSSQI